MSRVKTRQVAEIMAQASSKKGNGTRSPEGYVFPAGMPHPLQMLHRKPLVIR